MYIQLRSGENLLKLLWSDSVDSFDESHASSKSDPTDDLNLI